MTHTAPRLPTVGEIARRHNVPLHRVEYVIAARQIRPMGRAGNALVYSEKDVGLIGEELNRISSERKAVCCV
ncbi:MAG: hypothetical protein ACM359_18305 [Bacillota bacterium]